MFRNFFVFLLFFGIFISLISCAPSVKESAPKISSASQLNDSRYTIAGEVGTLSLQEGEKRFPKAKFKQFSFPIDMYLALETKKIDAIIYDRPVLEYGAANRKLLTTLPDELGMVHIVGAAPFRNKELIEKVNEFIKIYRADGTYDEMYQRWILSKNSTIPDIPKPENPTGTLIVGTDCQNEPMNFMGPNGQLVGFDIEFIHRLALFLNVKLDIKLMSYDALFIAAASDKVDLAVAYMEATDERWEAMLFTDSYIDNPIGLMIRKEDSALDDSEINDISQLYEKRIGVLTGSVYDGLTKEHLPSSIPVYFNTTNDLILALETKKIDAFLMDELQFPTVQREKPNIKRLPKEFAHYDYAFLFSKSQKELCDAFSEQIRSMKHDGTLKKLEEKWILSDSQDQTMQIPESDFPKGVLRFATVPESEPMSFVRDRQIVGFDIEIAYLIAERLGYRLEPMIMDWSSYVEAVASGKVDFGVGCTMITEERKQKVFFSEPNYSGAVIAVVRKEEPTTTEQIELKQQLVQFCQELAESFNRTFIRENRWKLILEGLKITVLITLFSAFFGTMIAFGVCALRRSKNFVLRLLGKCFIALMQGMPVLVILMILYYVVFARVNIDAVLVAVIGFSLNFSAYVAEMMRSAIDGIPKGQYEAALALGFKRSTAFRKIIFPQMLRRILPIYRGEFISMLKMTSIVGYIAIQDLTKMGDIIRSRTYEAFFPLIITAIIYFFVAHLLALGLTYIEFRLDPKNRRRVVNP